MRSYLYHNIETSPEFFPGIIGSYAFEDRVETLEIAKRAGMDLCVGVIFGIGESPTTGSRPLLPSGRSVSPRSR